MFPPTITVWSVWRSWAGTGCLSHLDASRDADLAQPQLSLGGWEKQHKPLLQGLLLGSARLLGACLQWEGLAVGSEAPQMCGDGASGMQLLKNPFRGVTHLGGATPAVDDTNPPKPSALGPWHVV